MWTGMSLNHIDGVRIVLLVGVCGDFFFIVVKDIVGLADM